MLAIRLPWQLRAPLALVGRVRQLHLHSVHELPIVINPQSSFRKGQSLSHLGFITMSVPGHLNPSLTLAAALKNRGHQITFLTLVDGVEKIEQAGFSARVFGEQKLSASILADSIESLSTLSGMKAVRHTIKMFHLHNEVSLDELPEMINSSRLNGLIVDQVSPAGSVIARALNIPYVTLCNALAIDLDPAVPPVFSHLGPSTGIFRRFQNRLLGGLANHLYRPILRQLNHYQRQWNQPKIGSIADLISDLAKIVQIPRAFDFHRQELKPNVHFVGPLHNIATRPKVEFPWDRLDSDRPLIYASMGTLQNRIRHVFGHIAEACAPLPVQLVVSFGGSADPEEFPDLSGDPIAVRFAPQLELLRRATVCITHAGLNTTMESLACGVPMLAIPVANDQPGVASRIQHHQLGLRLRLNEISTSKIRSNIEALLNNQTFAKNASAMQSIIQQSGEGADKAVEVVEKAIATGIPVLRTE